MATVNLEDEFLLFQDVVIDHFARKNGVKHTEIQLTYMHYDSNRFKAGCLIKPSYEIDTIDIRLEIN